MNYYKYLLFIILILTINITGFSQTYISGYITSNTVWDSINSPYIITSNTIVVDSVSLVILPGTIIKFDSQKTLKIDGTLKVFGNDSARVLFTTNGAATNGYWGALSFSAISKGSKFDYAWNFVSGHYITHADFFYGGYNDAIIESMTELFIKNCSFNNSTSTGVYINNTTTGGRIFITENNFTQAGISIMYNHNAKKITNNNINEGGITVYGNSVDSTYISNNIIKNTNLGISADCDNLYLLNNVIFVNPPSTYHNYGIQQSGYANPNQNIYGNIVIGDCVNIFGTGLLSNNIFINNYQLKTDIYINYPLTFNKNQFIECNNNSIVDFDAFMHLSGAAYNSTEYTYSNNLFEENITGSNMGLIQQRNNSDLRISLSNNNFINNSSTYIIKNLTPTIEVSAINNYWGTTISSEIEQLIYDWFNDGSVSIVNYSPFLSVLDISAPISRPTNIKLVKSCNGSLLSWDSNTETDTKGYRIYYGNFNGYQFENFIDIGDTNLFETNIVQSIYDTIAITTYDINADSINDLIEGHESWFRFVDLTTAINEFDLSNINNANIICEGDTITLFAENNYLSYLWSNLDTLDSTIVYMPGIYSVTATDTNGVEYCDSIQLLWESINLDLGPDTSLQEGETYTLSTTALGSFLWSDSSNTNNLIVDTTGIYWLELTSTLGCVYNDTVEITFYISIEENSFASSLSVYPNPTNDILNINLGNSHELVNFILSDINGKVLLEQYYYNKSLINFNVKNLPNGIYFVKLNSEDKSTRLKFIKR